MASTQVMIFSDSFQSDLWPFAQVTVSLKKGDI